MCYNGLSSRAADLVAARPLMPRRPAVLLTSLRSTSPSSLFRTFCTPLQKSEAHLLPLQSLPASLQKPQVCRHKRFSPATRHSSPATSANSPLFPALSPEGFALLHRSESHPLPFQSVAHSSRVYLGCRPQSLLNFSTLNSSTSSLSRRALIRLTTSFPHLVTSLAPKCATLLGACFRAELHRRILQPKREVNK